MLLLPNVPIHFVVFRYVHFYLLSAFLWQWIICDVEDFVVF